MSNISIRTFTVLPSLPEKLKPLQKLAYNMWWCWNHDAVALFHRIDPALFREVEHSPVKMLGRIPQERLQELVRDDGFLAHMERVESALDNYMNRPTWFDEQYGGPGDGSQDAADRYRIAYFSAEFGIHDSIPVYSGGLGLLSGDHLKAASDLGIPLVGVSLMYREGYFRQYLNIDGWQQERYPENDFFTLPLIPELDADGKPILVAVPFPGRDLMVRIWRIQVGRVPLYLLDANIPENRPEDREITARLYGGDHEMRIRQEMILGIGGVRALWQVQKPPVVCHMNEGHSAFSGLERIRARMEKSGLPFDPIRIAVTAGTCFTTHTPVPAGNDVFSPDLIQHYLSSYLPNLHLSREQLLGLGRQNPNDPSEPFCMTVLAIRLAQLSNGVSELHGHVSRRMWKNIWPDVPEDEVPIISITNGMHTPSWLSAELAQLYDRYLGLRWRERPYDPSVWDRVENIPNEELWRTHVRRRERLVTFARNRLRRQLQNRGAPPAEVASADEILNPDALTIGFARRFATYKRGTLIFRDAERLAEILNHPERPVQILFSGKAHPRDHGGKELIAEIIHMARRPEFRRRIVFIEDYDINVARYLVQGVDVWLNNPRRPLEASGTSGMKVAANGGLNLSILDGWWCEGFKGDNGWAIGAGEEYDDLVYQDDIESRAIYDLLEQEIVPTFYTRSSDGLPRQWIRMMKRSIQSVTSFFNTHRMLQEYMEKCYAPCAERFHRLAADGYRRAVALADWEQRLRQGWGAVRVDKIETEAPDPLHVGNEIKVTALIHLNDVAPQDVQVQLYFGTVDNLGNIQNAKTACMQLEGQDREPGRYRFRGVVPCRTSGQQGFAIRVLPRHEDLFQPFATGLIRWG